MRQKKGIQRDGLTRRGVLGAGAGAAAVAAIPATLTGGAVQAATTWQPRFFSATQGQALATLCDLILPRTETPSATEAGVHEYIDEALSVAPVSEQLEFLGGMAWFEARSLERFGKPFLELAEADQIAALAEIADDQKLRPELQPGAAFFTDLKERALFGYYTSKVGRTQALGLPETVRREKLQGCKHGSGDHA